MTQASAVAAPISVFGTTFQNPILLAAGTAGYGRELAGVMDLDRLGGIVTKAVSPEARAGHAAPRVTEFAGGILNAVGLANPGLDHVATVDLPWLAANLERARVLVNVVGFAVDDFVAVVTRLSELPVVTAFELNVSCPNTERGGREFGQDLAVVGELVGRCRQASSRPLIVKLAPDLEDPTEAAMVAAEAGADGFTLVNTLPAAQFGDDAAAAAERLGFGSGGVSGPCLLPMGVETVRRVVERTGLPVIGVGGVAEYRDVVQYLDAGATLVAVGTAALADPRVPERLISRWEADG